MPNNYNDFCENKKCDQYTEWEYYGECLISCKLVGQSYNIDEYPEECEFLDTIKLIVLDTHMKGA